MILEITKFRYKVEMIGSPKGKYFFFKYTKYAIFFFPIFSSTSELSRAQNRDQHS